MDGDRLLDAYIRLVTQVGGVRTNMKRVRRRREDRRAVRRARRDLRYLGAVARRASRARRTLRAVHRHYTDFVSNPGYALSLEAAALLHGLCEVRKPAAVLDLGSGFSSYVVRSYQAEAETAVRVKSVDDSPEWLGRTRAYLERKGLSTEGLCTPDELDDSDVGAYDLVCHDLGSMETREAFLPRVLAWVRPETGVVLLDDCHFPDYRSAVLAAVKRHDCACYDLRGLTMDRLGRSSFLLASIGAPPDAAKLGQSDARC